MLRSRLIVLAGLAVFAGCSGTDGTAPSGAPPAVVPEVPPADPSHTVISAVSPITLFGAPGDMIETPPEVQVALSPSGTPVAGIKVSFVDTRGNTYAQTTDSAGRAALRDIRFDSPVGQYNIMATAAGIGSVTFYVASSNAHVVSVYDLKTAAGQSPPFYYSAGPLSWVITGAHYQLFDDGTYRFGYDFSGETRWNTPGSYFRRDSTIEFYLFPSSAPASSFYAQRNYFFSVGTLAGSAMTVKYQDFVDFDDEEYSLR
jgi:hypothetical protein